MGNHQCCLVIISSICLYTNKDPRFTPKKIFQCRLLFSTRDINGKKCVLHNSEVPEKFFSRAPTVSLLTTKLRNSRTAAEASEAVTFSRFIMEQPSFSVSSFSSWFYILFGRATSSVKQDGNMSRT